MSKKLSLTLVAIFMFGAMHSQPRRGKPQKPKDETPQIVLSNFAAIFMNIISMAGNPHNPATLVQGGQGIVQGIANIVGTALKMVQQEEVSPEEAADLVYKKLIEMNIHHDIAEHVTTLATRHAFCSIKTYIQYPY